MITKDLAIQKAEAFVQDLSKGSLVDLLLIPEETIEFEYGWVFFYQTKEYIETGDVMQMAVGNAPIIVDKNSGELKLTGTGYPVEYYIEEYISEVRHR
jgi:hypothetical protein